MYMHKKESLKTDRFLGYPNWPYELSNHWKALRPTSTSNFRADTLSMAYFKVSILASTNFSALELMLF